MAEPGWRVLLLLAAAFRDGVEETHAALARAGHPEARPLHGFALQAIGSTGCSISELGQRLGVTKQAAAKTASALETAGYLEREAVPADRRAVLLRRTARAESMLTASETAFDEVVAGWRQQLGTARYEALVSALGEIADGLPVGDLPGLLSQRGGR